MNLQSLGSMLLSCLGSFRCIIGVQEGKLFCYCHTDIVEYTDTVKYTEFFYHQDVNIHRA